MSYEESTQCRQGIGRGLRDDVLCTLVTRGPDLDASSKTVEGFLVKSTACSPSLPQAGYGNRAMQLPQRAPPCSWTSLASNEPGILLKARRPFSCTRGPPCQGPKWDNGPPSPESPETPSRGTPAWRWDAWLGLRLATRAPKHCYCWACRRRKGQCRGTIRLAVSADVPGTATWKTSCFPTKDLCFWHRSVCKRLPQGSDGRGAGALGCDGGGVRGRSCGMPRRRRPLRCSAAPSCHRRGTGGAGLSDVFCRGERQRSSYKSRGRPLMSEQSFAHTPHAAAGWRKPATTRMHSDLATSCPGINAVFWRKFHFDLRFDSEALSSRKCSAGKCEEAACCNQRAATGLCL